MFKFCLYKFGQFVVRRLSLKNAYRIAMFFSDIQYVMSFRDRRAVQNNLRIILALSHPKENGSPKSDAELSFLVRDVFRNFGKYLVEFFRMANELDEKFIREKVKTKNPQYLLEAIAKKKGIIFLTAHIGNWELGGLILGMMGYPTLAIALPHKERPVNNLFNQQRERRGITIVPIKQAVHRCLSTLRSNKYIALLADRDFTSNGEMINFLGRDVLIPKGAALFSLKTGATILPTFLIRMPNDCFEIHLEQPIYPSDTALANGQIEQKDLVTLMTQYTRVIEKKICEYPTQWLMFREFWNQRLNVEYDE